jgi:lipopolysaccharide biosynthesis regulator YciM
VLYAESGLLDEAEQQLRILVRNNPFAGVAQKLLQNVQAMRAARN